jgi:hypothetical protein
MWLAAELKTEGHEVVVHRTSNVRPWPSALRLTFFLEKLLYQLPAEPACAIVDMRELSLPSGDGLRGQVPFDVVINCAGDFESFPSTHRILTPLFDCAPSELGAVEALLDGREITISLLEGNASGRILCSGTVACENRNVVTRTLNNVCSRAGDLVLKGLKISPTVADAKSTSVRTRSVDMRALSSSTAAVRSLVDRVAKKLTSRLTHVASSSDRWNVGWRNVVGHDLIDASGPRVGSYKILRDDGRRYYADPVVFRHLGEQYLFVEEYPFETSKGVISVSKLGEDGNFSTPRVIMEEPTHLSYPMVFEDDGQIFMVPESAENGTVTLYRSINFPAVWVPDCILISGLAAYDATIHKNADGYWMFVTTGRWQSTTRDSLSIFHAERLRGPWHPHSGNPVLIDARASRPAGAMFRIGEQLYRPAQDGAARYGDAIVLYRVDTLTCDEFRQTAVGRIIVTKPQEACGVHTYNRFDQLEVIDICGELSGTSHAEVSLRRTPENVETECPLSEGGIIAQI